MGSEAEEEEKTTAPKLPLFSLQPTNSPENYGGMGMATPPHHTASVPFRWEQEPGKPRQCTLPATNSTFKGLELPPRLLNGSKLTTEVLDGPYVGRSIFHSSRFIRCKEVSFDGGGSGTVRSLVVSKRWLLQAEEKAGFLGSWRKTGFGLRQGKEEVVVDDGSFAFCGLSGEGDRVGDDGREDGSSGDARVEEKRNTRKRSTLSLTKSRLNFCANIYEAVKQAIPSRRRSTNGKCKY